MFRDSILIENTRWEESVMQLADPKREDVDKYVLFEENSSKRRSMRESIFIIENMMDDALRCLNYFAELPKEKRETKEVMARQTVYRNVCVWLGEWKWKCLASVKVIKLDPLHYLDDNVHWLMQRFESAYREATGEEMPANWFYVQGTSGFMTGDELKQFKADSDAYKALAEMIRGVLNFFETSILDKPINTGK